MKCVDGCVLDLGDWELLNASEPFFFGSWKHLSCRLGTPQPVSTFVIGVSCKTNTDEKLICAAFVVPVGKTGT